MRAAASLLLVPLLLSLAAPVSAAAADELVPKLDVTDAANDARAYPDVTLPQTDIVRFTVDRQGADVVQTVHVAGPIPENNYWFEIRNALGGSDSLTLKLERMNSSGSNVRPTDYPSATLSVLSAARSERVNFTFERTETSVSFRWPASVLPASATCFSPKVTTLSRTTVDGRSQQVDDDLEMSPNLCAASGVRTDGLDGTCPAAASAQPKPSTLTDERGDVGKRNNLAYLPHDNATLDILSLETRIEDGWIVQTVKTAERSPRDQADFEILTQYRGNKSDFERGAYASVQVFESGGGGGLVGEASPTRFHVRVERTEPGGWEARWCASILPPDAVCFATSARVSLQNDDLRDVVGLPKDPCPQPDDGSADETAGTGTDKGTGTGTGGDADAGTGDEGEVEGSDTPAPGALALLAALAVAALAFRRRG